MIKKIFFSIAVLLFANAINAQQNNTFLWRITNPVNQQPSYLFGTIHLPQEKFMQLTDSVYDAVNNTDIFYGELDFLNIYKEMSDADGFFQSKLDYLDSVKKTDSWRRMIMSVNRTYNASINPDSLDQFNKFGQSLLADYMKADPGVTALDAALSSYAMVLGKTTKGLETFKFQIDMLYKIIDARLTDTTLLFDDDIRLTTNLKRFYSNQQFDSLTAIIESINITYRKIVFDNRNFTMADSIKNISANKTAFFAVGCGHLLGKNGIINLLKAKGLQLSPVFSTNKLSITLLESIFKTGIDNVKKELKKEKADTDTEVMPDEKIEEIREDVMISTLPVKKAVPKKTAVKQKPKTKKQ
ncbi:TraB/GumN family protein [Ferruginibacter sp.]